MSVEELPKMVRTFLKLFRWETDDKIKSDFVSIDSTMDGDLDLHEFIKVSRVAVYNNFKHTDELISHLNNYRTNMLSKSLKKKYFGLNTRLKEIDAQQKLLLEEKEVIMSELAKHDHFNFVLDYKLVDDFTIGTEDEKKAFLIQFKGALKFLDTDLSGKVDLDEIVKLVRVIESMPDDDDNEEPFVKKQFIMRKRESVNYCDGIDIFHTKEIQVEEIPAEDPKPDM